ncbi:hypothetical protein BLD44_009295 [Mastigocladus laminosus UU774]|nr:hypothetical protein BLD44_009295 [Mastigocladus laminosus UU774]
MSNENNKKDWWDKLQVVTVVFTGIISLGLAVGGFSINQAVNKVNFEVGEANKKILALQESKMRSENEPHILFEFQIFQAKTFQMQERNASDFLYVYPVDKVRNNLTNWLRQWQQTSQIMTGSVDEGLVTRQLVCIRVMNTGGTVAKGIKLRGKIFDFDNIEGTTLSESYHELKINRSNGIDFETKPIDLQPVSLTRMHRSIAIIPLAHISAEEAKTTFFGFAAVPMTLVWKNSEGKEFSEPIDINADPVLKNFNGVIGVSTSLREYAERLTCQQCQN